MRSTASDVPGPRVFVRRLLSVEAFIAERLNQFLCNAEIEICSDGPITGTFEAVTLRPSVRGLCILCAPCAAVQPSSAVLAAAAPSPSCLL